MGDTSLRPLGAVVLSRGHPQLSEDVTHVLWKRGSDQRYNDVYPLCSS